MHTYLMVKQLLNPLYDFLIVIVAADAQNILQLRGYLDITGRINVAFVMIWVSFHPQNIFDMQCFLFSTFHKTRSRKATQCNGKNSCIQTFRFTLSCLKLPGKSCLFENIGNKYRQFDYSIERVVYRGLQQIAYRAKQQKTLGSKR